MSPELEELQDILDKKAAKQKFREYIYKQWQGKCAYCERVAESLDHVKPQCRGGQTTTLNLVPACLRCNQSKSSHELESWWREQYYFDQDRFEAVKFWQETGYLFIDQSGE